jgi:hypothetical protein
VIFREEDFSEEEFRSVALLVERRAGDCGRDESGKFGSGNDCASDGSDSHRTPHGTWDISKESKEPSSENRLAPTHVVRLTGDDGKVKAYVDVEMGGDGETLYVDYAHVSEKERGKGVYKELLGSLSNEYTIVSDEMHNVATPVRKAYEALGARVNQYGQYVLEKKKKREARAADCGRNDDGTFGMNNDCQEDGGGISGNISPFAKSRTPAAKKEKKKGGGGDKVSRPPAQERVSSLTTKSLFDGSEKLELPKERGAVREETIARALTQRAIAAHGGTPINVDKPVDDSDIEVMSDALADDIQGAYERSGRHAGWYSQDVGDAMEIANGLPGNERISQDPIDKFVFGFGMGILSAQNGVEDNARYADGFYRNWRETGSLIVPEEYSHALGRGIDTGHFKTMQALVDRNGWDEVIKFFSSADRVSTIAEDGKVLLPGFDGFKVSKEHVDTKVPRLAIFGPKIGPFTHAIVNGDYDHLVMDRWTMRQAGAITGTLLKETDPEKARGHAERLLSASSSNRAGSAMWYGLPKAEVMASLKRTLKTGRFEEQDVGWEFVRRVQSAYSKSINPSTGGGYGDKTELNLAANNAFKTKVEMQLAPGNGTVANNVRNIFAKATEKTGASNILEVQALGWVDTQNLWQTLGYRLKKDPNENTFSSAFDALRSGRRPRITSLEEEAERIKSQKAASRRSFEPEFEDDFDTTPLDVFGGEYQSIFDEAVSSEEYREALVERISEQIRKSSSREFRSARSFFKSLATQVHSARADGQPSVTLRAGEARHLLPRIGFDAPIPAELRDSLPESLSHARTLIDLHVTKEGSNWWRDNGTDAEVFLDTADHTSPQNRAFDAFVRKFFHESRDLPVGSGDGWVSSVDLIKFDELWAELDSEGVWDEYDSEGLEFRSADCGANKEGGGGFQEGNTCGGGDRSLASKGEISKRFESGEKPSQALQSLGFRRMNFTAIDKALETADDKQKQRILADLDSLAKAIAVDKRLADVPIRVGTVSEIFKNNKEVLRSLRDDAKAGSLGAVADAESGTLAIFTDSEEYDESEYEKGWNSSNKREAMVLHELAHLEHYKSAAQAFPHPGEDELPGVHPIDYYMTKAESRATSLLKKEPSLKKKVRGVSEYASTDVFEFVAEYSSAVSLGEIQPDKDLDRLCVAAGAKPPRRSKR